MISLRRERAFRSLAHHHRPPMSFQAVSARSSGRFFDWCACMRRRMSSERAHRLDDVRALVEHHALGALAHRRVGDLGARGQPGLGQRLEHLRRPDRPACAPPRRATGSPPAPRPGARSRTPPPGRRARSSRPAARPAMRRKQQLRQVLEAAAGLDLQDDAEVLRAELAQLAAAAGARRRRACANDSPTRSACRGDERPGRRCPWR